MKPQSYTHADGRKNVKLMQIRPLQNALRVPPAVTRLTVYRRLDIGILRIWRQTGSRARASRQKRQTTPCPLRKPEKYQIEPKPDRQGQRRSNLVSTGTLCAAARRFEVREVPGKPGDVPRSRQGRSPRRAPMTAKCATRLLPTARAPQQI